MVKIGGWGGGSRFALTPLSHVKCFPTLWCVTLTPSPSYCFLSSKVRNDHAHTYRQGKAVISSIHVWLCINCMCVAPPPFPSRGSFYSSHPAAGIRLAFGRFDHSGSLSEQEEIPLTSRSRVLLAFCVFPKVFSLCVLQPVLVSHIPHVMTHYPSTQNTVSPGYFTAVIKSRSRPCCFISLIL